MSVLDLFRLDGRVVIVTGASSGLGVSFAQGFAEAGADLVLGARRVDRMSQTAALVEQAGARVCTHQTDVTDPEQCQQLVDFAMVEFGRVDVLINNAGVGTAVPSTRETAEEFRAVIDVNLNGSYWMAQACGRVMKPGSAIINIASVLGLTTGGLPQAAYSASKGGIVGMTLPIARDLSRNGIRNMTIAPGIFGTPMMFGMPKEVQDSLAASVPFPSRLGTPQDYAKLAVHIFENDMLNGEVIRLDGAIRLAPR